MRIKEHPILTFEEKKKLSFFFDGKEVYALHALGIKTLSHSIELNRPRGFYCAIGNCSSCNMVVDGKPNVRTCVTMLVKDMVVKTQIGKGDIYEKN